MCKMLISVKKVHTSQQNDHNFLNINQRCQHWPRGKNYRLNLKKLLPRPQSFGLSLEIIFHVIMETDGRV